MKVKILIVILAALGYMTVAFPNSFTVLSRSFPLDGTNPPHAVDTSGKAIPDKSATQPDKPIILAKDSPDKRRSELKPEAAFDHAKHATDISHSLDGKSVTTCVECHHTEQPSAKADQPYLKKFARKATLTASQLESSKEPVVSCRACHFQASTEETDEYPPEGVEYPKSTGKRATEKITNQVAYHINCNECHDAAMKRDPKLKAPQVCIDCHTKK